jgi:hypothetical protein
MTGIPGGGSDLSPKTCRSPKNFSFELKPSVSRGAEGEEGEEGAGVGEGVGGREEVLIRPGPGRPRKKVYGSLLTLNGSLLTLYGTRASAQEGWRTLYLYLYGYLLTLDGSLSTLSGSLLTLNRASAQEAGEQLKQLEQLLERNTCWKPRRRHSASFRHSMGSMGLF